MTVQDLPTVNACLNGLSAILLAAGYFFIKQGDKAAHKKCMIGAFSSSVVFLIGYLIYHYFAGHTRFLEPQWFRPWYLALLASHVILAAAIVPLVLMTLHRAVRARFELHRRIARWTWPLWMYVSVTGVAIYFILYHVFPQN